MKGRGKSTANVTADDFDTKETEPGKKEERCGAPSSSTELTLTKRIRSDTDEQGVHPARAVNAGGKRARRRKLTMRVCG